MTTVLSAMIEPTERSMPAATMTIVMPERGRADDRGLAGDQLEVDGPEELRADEPGEDGADEEEAEEGPAAREQVARLHAASPRAGGRHHERVLVPLAAGRGAPSRPRHMTAMRSQTPSSSAR